MGFETERPIVGEVQVQAKAGNGDELRKGADVDDVVRAVIWDMADRGGWSEAETAKRLGVPQSTLHDFMTTGRGARLHFLSRICAAARLDPVAFFQSHERYSPDNREAIRFVDDAVYDRFRTLLNVDQARRLVEVLDRLVRGGTIEAGIELLEKKLEIDRGAQKGRRSS